MEIWSNFLSEIHTEIQRLADNGCDIPFFRGHEDSSWKLIPSLGRRPKKKFKKDNLECILYYDFLSYAGPLMGNRNSSWDILFAMQHHGLPTRLLDWSETFAVALYFALKNYLLNRNNQNKTRKLPEPAIWILEPFELNNGSSEGKLLYNPETDFTVTYQELFIDETGTLDGKVIALIPSKSVQRLVAQKGVFTLHQDISSPIEELYPNYVKKFVIPKDAIPKAIEFLQLAGMNEFSLFPDLDGLARHLKHLHVNSE